MEQIDFWLVLISGIVMGLLLSISARWMGGKWLSGNHPKEERDLMGKVKPK